MERTERTVEHSPGIVVDLRGLEARAADRVAAEHDRVVDEQRRAEGAEVLASVERRRTLTPIPVEIDHTPLAKGAGHAALTLAAAQLAGSLVMAAVEEVRLGVAWWFGVVPHLSFQVGSRSQLVRLVDVSTAAAALAVLAGVAWTWLTRRRTDPLYQQGWSFGVVMVFLLCGLGYLRHLLDPPLASPWLLTQLAAAAAALGLVVFGLGSDGHPTDDPDLEPHRTTQPPESS